MAGSTFKLIFLWLIPCVSLQAALYKWIYFIGTEKSWSDAQQDCRQNHVDLLTVWHDDEKIIDKITESFLSVSKLWIGLKRDTNIGKWNWTERSYDRYVPERIGYDCAAVKKPLLGKLSLISASCSEMHKFYCSPGDTIHTEALPWSTAEIACERNGGNLSTVTHANIANFDEGWVGLRKDTDGPWRWVGEQSYFSDWKDGHPITSECGAYDLDTREFLGLPCEKKLPYLCFKDSLTMVTENKTWEEALLHCRSLTANSFTYDLLSSQYDHALVNERVLTAVTNEVWIGLRFLAGQWKWMDGEKMEHQGLPLCAPQWKHCGTRHKYNPNLEIRDCMEKRNFICYKTPTPEPEEENKEHPKGPK